MQPFARQAVMQHPRVIVLTAGTNDIRLHHDIAAAARKFIALVDFIRPRATLIVTLAPPIADVGQTLEMHRLHRLLRPALASRNIPVITLDALEENGMLAPRYTMDGVHLSAPAYAIWSRKLRALL